MGYTLSIGNAKVESGNEYGELWARWSVEAATHPDAPTFPNDDMTGNGNHRSPSYSAWAEFARNTGLETLFFDKDAGLIAKHPGCVPLTEAHHTEVLAALNRWRATAEKPPGFSGIGALNEKTRQWETPDQGRYDHTLARLLWVEWWMRWALQNCETPAFENT
jgi:hypothetical protein